MAEVSLNKGNIVKYPMTLRFEHMEGNFMALLSVHLLDLIFCGP